MRRRAAWALVAVGVCVLAILWIERAPDRDAPPPARPHVPPVSAAPPPSAEPTLLSSDEGEEEELPLPIRRWLERTPYPASSGRLTDAHVDLLEPNRRSESERPIPDSLGSGAVTTLFTADRYYYTGADDAEVTLKAWRGGEPVALDVREARMVPEGRAGPSGSSLQLPLRWEADGYRARVPMSSLGDHHGPVLVSVRYEYEPGREHHEELRFFVTPLSRIPARLTGEVSEALRAGSLELAVEVDVALPGFFRFDANLRNGAGEPVAFTSWKGELAAGRNDVPLEVYGKVLRDAGIQGPWTLSDVRAYRFLDGRFPDRERLPDGDLSYETKAWPLDGFTNDVHTSEHELRMVEIMKVDLERGLGLDMPAPPQASAGPAAPLAPDDADWVEALETEDSGRSAR